MPYKSGSGATKSATGLEADARRPRWARGPAECWRFTRVQPTISAWWHRNYNSRASIILSLVLLCEAADMSHIAGFKLRHIWWRCVRARSRGHCWLPRDGATTFALVLERRRLRGPKSASKNQKHETIVEKRTNVKLICIFIKSCKPWPSRGGFILYTEQKYQRLFNAVFSYQKEKKKKV